jgi:radical SAM superfamily enzyme YgiQ (UPF0313 family)
MPADITLVNLNMLFMRYAQEIERELHVPLGCLYLTKALEQAGFAVDFRDYQLCPSDTPFDMEVFTNFLADPAPVIGLSCMANLLPFTILAARALKDRWPDRVLVLGGVGPKGAEETILRRFPWVDVICRGEGERTAVELMAVLRGGGDLSAVAGISWRRNTEETERHGQDAHATQETARHGQDARATPEVVHNPDRARIEDLDGMGFPAWEKVDLSKYAGYGMMTSRGCPYLCTFCSVAPVWNHQSFSRSPKSIVDEIEFLHRSAGVKLFLFQDEFFVSGKRHVMDFCRELTRRGLDVTWKAFGRVNLMDVEMMHAMADCGCLELRFGVESGSDRILKLVKKGFTSAQTMEVVPPAIEIFPRVDTFYVWGFPFETMEDFNQSLFQMVSFRMMGGRILPSLLSLLPQTEVYRQCASQYTLEFCPFLLPEFVFTGHEVADAGEMDIPPQYQAYFRLITDNPDIFPGFFHVDLKNNVMPKLELLRQFGFYPQGKPAAKE